MTPKTMNAITILRALDERLDTEVELTLYGRAAIQLGYRNPPDDVLLSLDVDAVFWIGQAEQLNEQTNFWEAVEDVNRVLSDNGLYISHFFTEDMVILREGWKEARKAIDAKFNRLKLYRLSDIDLLLSKLMRDDPQDMQDALFIVRTAKLTPGDIRQALRDARLPSVPEVVEQFQAASDKLLTHFNS